MSEHEDQSDRLKQHFAQRVINQARQVLEVWQRLQRNAWSKQEMDELQEGNQRLLRYAERFEQPEHCQIAEGIELPGDFAHMILDPRRQRLARVAMRSDLRAHRIARFARGGASRIELRCGGIDCKADTA